MKKPQTGKPNKHTRKYDAYEHRKDRTGGTKKKTSKQKLKK